MDLLHDDNVQHDFYDAYEPVLKHPYNFGNQHYKTWANEFHIFGNKHYTILANQYHIILAINTTKHGLMNSTFLVINSTQLG